MLMKFITRLSVIFLIVLVIVSIGCVSGPSDNENQTTPDDNGLNGSGFEPPSGNISLKDEESLVRSNNEFAFDLYEELSSINGNMFFSPWSISTALKMTYEGSRNDSEKEMRQVLHLPENKSKTRQNYYLIHKKIEEVEDYELIEANAFWYKKDYPFSKNYKQTITNYYDGRVSELNFSEKTDESKKIINDWVANKTQDKIPELLKTLSPTTKAVLTNSIYFKGMWKNHFDEDLTKNETFYTGEGTAEVPMMNGEKDLYYGENQNYKILKMPYKNNSTNLGASMLIILPKNRENSLNQLEQLELSELNQLRSKLKRSSVDIKFPKFKYETKYDKELKQALINLGMKKAFTTEANFNGMTEDSNPLFISQVVHNAYVNVNENGTEAAAATAVILRESAPVEKNEFHANHPFTYIIQNNNQNILFIGKVKVPKQG